jgi:hypothetical protein
MVRVRPRFDRDVQLLAVDLPRGFRAIGVHLDAEAVWIGQVNRLADGVVGAGRMDAQVRDVTREAAERRPIRQQHREVVQAEQTVSRNRSRIRALVEFHQRLSVAVRAQCGDAAFGSERPQAQDLCVVLQRSLKITDLQPHATDPRRRRQPIPGWRDAEWLAVDGHGLQSSVSRPTFYLQTRKNNGILRP